jgi:hypothetical protein
MHIVIFEEGMIPRIVHNVDPSKYDFNKILVNPVLPRGIPPHRWLKGKNCIEVLPEEVVHIAEVRASELPKLPLPPALKSPKGLSSTFLYHALAVLASSIISLIIHKVIH